jgi:hypothetical protein
MLILECSCRLYARGCFFFTKRCSAWKCGVLLQSLFSCEKWARPRWKNQHFPCLLRERFEIFFHVIFAVHNRLRAISQQVAATRAQRKHLLRDYLYLHLFIHANTCIYLINLFIRIWNFPLWIYGTFIQHK